MGFYADPGQTYTVVLDGWGTSCGRPSVRVTGYPESAGRRLLGRAAAAGASLRAAPLRVPK